MRKLTHGTANFVSLASAVSYYWAQGYGDTEKATREIVKEKLAAGEIHIGKPEVPAGGKLFVIDHGTRYAIES